MKRNVPNMFVASALVAIGLGICMPSLVKAQGPLMRLSAEFQNFDFTETETPLGVPGIAAYQKTLFVPAGVNVLYVTMSTTADSHSGNAGWFSCNVDGAFCNPGVGGSDGAPPGWLAFSKHFDYDNVTYNGGISGGDGGGGNGDIHDNAVYYTWCTQISPGPHTVQIRLASSLTGNPAGFSDVFFEGAHFYIDASSLDGGCRQSLPPPGNSRAQKSGNVKNR